MITVRKTVNFLCVLSLLFSLCCLAGCGSGATPESAIADANQSNIQRLANLYMMYQVQHKFQGPKDETEFKTFLRGIDPEVLKPMGIEPDGIDELFICEQDREPFQIRYGVASGPRGSKEAVIFQKTGSSGKRMVAFLNMVQREVEDAEYESLFSAKPNNKPQKTKPPRSGAGESRSG